MAIISAQLETFSKLPPRAAIVDSGALSHVVDGVIIRRFQVFFPFRGLAGYICTVWILLKAGAACGMRIARFRRSSIMSFATVISVGFQVFFWRCGMAELKNPYSLKHYRHLALLNRQLPAI